MKLDFIEPFIKFLPEIAPPQRPPHLREKIGWTVAALVIFFVMYHVYPIGLNAAAGRALS